MDVGEGVAESLEKSGTDVTYQSKIISDIPNAVLITDSHDDQIKDFLNFSIRLWMDLISSVILHQRML